MGVPATAEAAAPAKAKEPAAWCGQGFEALPNDVCHIDGRKNHDGKRTLVIWLHGVIGKKTDWSQKHQKMLQRVAKASNVEVIFPKAPEADTVYAWPGTAESQEKKEGALIDQWMNAKTILEKRENKSYDEVFVFGFSSGAYFTSSLAMRGRVDVDGYAVFAGGQPMPAKTEPVTHFAPVFVGVCADDAQTANHSRAFGGSLAAAGIPRMVSEQRVGHGLSEVHWVQALAFLRNKMKPRTMPV